MYSCVGRQQRKLRLRLRDLLYKDCLISSVGEGHLAFAASMRWLADQLEHSRDSEPYGLSQLLALCAGQGEYLQGTPVMSFGGCARLCTRLQGSAGT